MDKQFRHAMLPQALHDEQARQDFIGSLKMHIAKNIAPGNQKIYEEVVKPKFERENQRSPQNRHEIRKIMQHESHYRWWSALRRINQEMLWDAVNTSVDRQLPELMDAFSAFMYDWETANNNEPFWSAMRDLDLVMLATSAGFEVEKMIEKFVPNTISGQVKPLTNSKQGKSSKRGTWFVISSIK